MHMTVQKTYTKYCEMRTKTTERGIDREETNRQVTLRLMINDGLCKW